MKTNFLLSFVLICVSIQPVWAQQAKAVDFEVFNNESAIYILYNDGHIQKTGFAPDFGEVKTEDALDLVITPSGKGYYIFHEDGTLDAFGDALNISTHLSDEAPFAEMKIDFVHKTFYFLRRDGAIRIAGEGEFYGESIRQEKAVDLEMYLDGYYVLYEDGLIEFFGDAVNRGYTQSHKKAVDLELELNGYYVLYEDATVEPFGDIPPLPAFAAYEEPAVDLTLTPEGYRVLFEDGEVQNFIQVEQQGRAKWYALAQPRQLPTSTPTATPTLTATPTQTPRPSEAYFNLTDSAFTAEIVSNIPDTAVLPSSMGNSATALFGGGLFVAAAGGEGQPLNKILYYPTTVAENVEEQDVLFATINEQRGQAAIQGLAYSREGLYVVIDDANGGLVFLIRGEFEETNVGGFSLY